MKRRIAIIILAPIGIALFILIGGELVMHLWNWLLPPLFGWRQINFWQAFGLLALCRILFVGAAPMPQLTKPKPRPDPPRCQFAIASGRTPNGASPHFRGERGKLNCAEPL
jgi:MFS family permease